MGTYVAIKRRVILPSAVYQVVCHPEIYVFVGTLFNGSNVNFYWCFLHPNIQHAGHFGPPPSRTFLNVGHLQRLLGDIPVTFCK